MIFLQNNLLTLKHGADNLQKQIIHLTKLKTTLLFVCTETTESKPVILLTNVSIKRLYQVHGATRVPFGVGERERVQSRWMMKRWGRFLARPTTCGPSHGALQQQELNNQISPTVKQLWNYVLHEFFEFNINTAAFCLGRSSLHLLLQKSSMPQLLSNEHHIVNKDSRGALIKNLCCLSIT